MDNEHFAEHCRDQLFYMLEVRGLNPRVKEPALSELLLNMMLHIETLEKQIGYLYRNLEEKQ